MNKEELKYGNLIEILTSNTQFPLPTSRYGTILEIKEDKVKVRYDYETSDGFCVFNRRYNTIHPVRINKQILDELNFEFNSETELYAFPVISEFDKVKLHYHLLSKRIVIDGIKLPVQTEYVHQLQNDFYTFKRSQLDCDKLRKQTIKKDKQWI